jgi:hypothetical protein
VVSGNINLSRILRVAPARLTTDFASGPLFSGPFSGLVGLFFCIFLIAAGLSEIHVSPPLAASSSLSLRLGEDGIKGRGKNEFLFL